MDSKRGNVFQSFLLKVYNHEQTGSLLNG